MKNNFIGGFIFSIVFALTISAQADIKMQKKISTTIAGMGSLEGMIESLPKKGQSGLKRESTVYVKGSRVRSEQLMEAYDDKGKKQLSMTAGIIQQCDLKRNITFNSKTKKYSVTPFADVTIASGPNPSKFKGGVVSVNATFTDTGERKEMFGYMARRIKSVSILTPNESACNREIMKVETDGWYVDLPSFSCSLAPPSFEMMNNRCVDRYVYQITGKPENGFALWESKTISLGSFPGMTIIEEVISLEKTTLDDALFEIPKDYKETKDSNELSEGFNQIK